jgi:hypothetical protein
MIKKCFYICTTIALTIILLGCPKKEYPKFQPPPDHTDNIEGVKHKYGYEEPDKNCVACHGQDLRGGEKGVSCYTCHEKEW